MIQAEDGGGIGQGGNSVGGKKWPLSGYILNIGSMKFSDFLHLGDNTVTLGVSPSHWYSSKNKNNNNKTTNWWKLLSPVNVIDKRLV